MGQRSSTISGNDRIIQVRLPEAISADPEDITELLNKIKTLAKITTISSRVKLRNNITDLIKALKKTYDTETMIKSSYNIKKKTLLKKLLIDICNLANAA